MVMDDVCCDWCCVGFVCGVGVVGVGVWLVVLGWVVLCD